MDLLKFRTLKSKLNREGSLSLRVASNSMVPVLKTGQIISVKRAEIANLKKFDILVFLQNEIIMCHFLWSVQTGSEGQVELITKSIENPTEIDIPLKEGLLLGKVDATIPIHIKIKIWLKNL